MTGVPQSMQPMDGEAAVMIPAGNMRTDVPGTYGWMRSHYNKTKANKKIKTTDGGFMSW